MYYCWIEPLAKSLWQCPITLVWQGPDIHNFNHRDTTYDSTKTMCAFLANERTSNIQYSFSHSLSPYFHEQITNGHSDSILLTIKKSTAKKTILHQGRPKLKKSAAFKKFLKMTHIYVFSWMLWYILMSSSLTHWGLETTNDKTLVPEVMAWCLFCTKPSP